MPPFDAPYAQSHRCGKWPAPDDIPTMAPPPADAIERAACLMQIAVPMRLRSTVARTEPMSASTTGPMWSEPPALATRTSSPPDGLPSAARATAASTCSSFVTSAAIQREPCPIVSRAASSFSGVRPQMVTTAPSAASRAAVPSPIPLPPPVTSACRPANPSPISSSSARGNGRHSAGVEDIAAGSGCYCLGIAADRRPLEVACAPGRRDAACGPARGWTMSDTATTAPLPKRTATVEGRTMAYHESGEGPPVVFLHGNPTSSCLWRNVIPHVRDRARCIAPDLIGHGDSDKVPDSGPGSYRFVEHRRYLDGLLDQLDLGDEVTLVVHDWGSALGFDWANRHRDRVAGIAYMEAIVAPVTWDDWPDDARDIFRAFRS